MRYCIGDIHGCVKTLEGLVGKILEKDPKAAFYFVGDLIDRGPDSKGVIDYLIELKESGYVIRSIMGNHEQMFLNAYEKNIPVHSSNWAFNGAEQTISSFTKSYKLNQTAKDLIPEKYYQFIKSLPYFIETEAYFIVHAGFNFYSAKPFEDLEFMLWTRKEENDPKYTNGKKIIHGHTPISKEEMQSTLKNNSPDVINVDTGCVYIQRTNLGYLTALNMDTMEIVYTKNSDMFR